VVDSVWAELDSFFFKYWLERKWCCDSSVEIIVSDWTTCGKKSDPRGLILCIYFYMIIWCLLFWFPCWIFYLFFFGFIYYLDLFWIPAPCVLCSEKWLYNESSFIFLLFYRWVRFCSYSLTDFQLQHPQTCLIDINSSTEHIFHIPLYCVHPSVRL
jgi:hypothetical protein